MSRQQERPSYTERNRVKNTERPRNYVEGNTVRKLNAVPQRIPREREVHRETQKADVQTRKNRQRAMQMSPGYILFLTLAVVATVGVCAMYLQLQAENSQSRRHIASLESQILELKTENDAAENRIESSVNMEEIKNTAMNEMGMVYPGQDQVVYYTVEKNDYMNQYQDIPD